MAEPIDDRLPGDPGVERSVVPLADERQGAVAVRRPSESVRSSRAEPVESEPSGAGERAGSTVAAVAAEPEVRGGDHEVPPPPPAPVQPVEVPAAHDAAPRTGGNRLFALGWVLLAAGLFEAIYLALLVLYLYVVGGAQATDFAAGGADSVRQNLPSLFGSPLTWVPVLVFTVLYALTVIALNRAGRFAYVVTGLVVGLLVYLLSIALTFLLQGAAGAPSLLARALVLPQFALAGIVAREVMLWTGYAVGRRGHRLRRTERQAVEAQATEPQAVEAADRV